MRPKKDPYLSIGIFSAIAGVLLVVALFFWGAFKNWQRGETFNLIFNTSLNGLDIGSPVKFKGVNVGAVQDIVLKFDDNEMAKSYVTIKINTDLLQTISGQHFNIGVEDELIEQVQKGLRAKLEYQSYVTGRVFIDLDYYPYTPLPNPVMQKIGKVMCIPTIPSPMREFWKTIMGTMEKLNQIDFVQLASSVQGSFDALQVGVKALGRAADTFQNTVAPGSELLVQFEHTLRSVDDAASAVRLLADFLERHPEGLLAGKSAPAR